MFDKDVTMNVLLYVLSKYDGECDIHTICKIMFFADQEHLSKYGRAITGDSYIAKPYGGVPSKLYDIMRAVRGDSYFSDKAEEFKALFRFKNKQVVMKIAETDMDYLSESDIECIDNAIAKVKDKSFGEITQLAHGYAWTNTQQDREISVKDMLRELGDTEEYVEYVSDKIKTSSLMFV